MLRERDIERYLVERTRALGGEVRKLKWIGRNGAPDRIVMLNGKVMFIELKAPGKPCQPHQLREHERMRRLGQSVVVADSFEQINEALA